MTRSRFNPLDLDPEDPFELDSGNRPHLFKHLLTDDTGRSVAFTEADLLDLYIYGGPAFYEANETGPADWLMLGEIPGIVVQVPLAPPNSGDPAMCRPIGTYKPSAEDRLRYLRGE
jgi:hypothetical protein